MLTISSATQPQTSNTAFPSGTFDNGLETHQPRFLPVRRLIVVATLLALTFFAVQYTAASPAFPLGSVPRQSGEGWPVFSLPALCATSDIQGPDGLRALQCALPANR